MELQRVNPEIRNAVAHLGTLPLDRPGARRLAKLVAELKPAAKTAGTEVQRVRNSNVTARLIRPTAAPGSPTGAVLWFHGGGFVMGTTKQDASLLGKVSLELGVPTLSVAYPLAPGAHIADMLQVASRAWTWLLDQAFELGVRPDRIVIGGESAGAQLASVLVQHICDRGGQQPAGAWLFAPATDDRIALSNPEEVATAGSHFIIDRKTYAALVPQYSGHVAGDSEMPDYVFANRREDLAGLPPTWLYCGSIELFHDEIVAYANRLKEAGVATDLVVVDGAVHSFEVLWPRTNLAQDLFTTALAWLNGVLK